MVRSPLSKEHCGQVSLDRISLKGNINISGLEIIMNPFFPLFVSFDSLPLLRDVVLKSLSPERHNSKTLYQALEKIP